MTIRARIAITQSVLAVVVIAFSILVIRLAEMAKEIARLPVAHVDALGHVHELFDSAGQAIKDLDDLATGEDDKDECEEQMNRARQALSTIRDQAHDPIVAAIAGELTAKFEELESGYHRVLALVAAGDLAAAKDVVAPLGEDMYEGELRPLLGRLQERALAITDAVRIAGEDDARAASIRAVLLVIVAVLALIVGTAIVFQIRRRLSRLVATVNSMSHDIRGARSNDTGATDELGDLSRAFDRMADDVATLIDTTAANEALTSELALASRIQQSLLPPAPRVSGLEIAGAMSAVTQVGGDYYDVMPTRDGAWIAIGDVSGHGFNTGVITMLAQSAISSVVRSRPDAQPVEVLSVVNDVLNELVHSRLHLRDHMALTLLRYYDDGTVEFAGAHQEIIVRAADGSARVIETTGPWLAVLPDIGPDLVAARFTLGDDETMVLFTDGVVEARVGTEEMFGLPRLLEVLSSLPHDASPESIRDAVFSRVASIAPILDDDATVLVIRRPALTHLRAAS